jgi:hypothetical protein
MLYCGEIELFHFVRQRPLAVLHEPMMDWSESLENLKIVFSFSDRKSSVPDAKIGRGLNYHYLLDVNRIFYFSPFPRDMFVIVSLDNPSLAESGHDARSELHITAYLPNLIEWRRVDRGPSACPPFPSN